MQNSFATGLKHWRSTRRVSQLELGLDSNVSARHISFLETGRAAPSRAMVLRLADALDIPRSPRNTLLNAAGFATVYQERPLDSPDLDQVSEAIDWMIMRHDPYPAIVFDRLWRVVRVNNTGMVTLSVFGINIGDSLLDAFVFSGKSHELFDNWPEVASHMIHQLRAQSARLGGVEKLDQAATILAADPDVKNFNTPTPLPAVIPTRYKIGGQVLSMFTTLAHFSTAEDIALADLQIELMFPADEPTKQFLLSAMG